MKNRYHGKGVSLLLCALCAALLTGCSTYVPLSERAIVKAIYLNGTPQNVQASLVVYTCKASANTADVTGTPRIYQGEGSTIEKALADAEEQQNKKPFYAQNRLLFLGEDTFDNIFLQFRKLLLCCARQKYRKVCARYLLCTKIRKITGNIAAVVDESEHLTLESHESGNKTRAIHELRYDENNRFFGYLPLVELASNDFTGVRELLLYESGVPVCALREIAMQLTLLLTGKASTLKIEVPGAEQDITVQTQRLFLERETARDGTFSLQISGKVESVTQNGHMLQGEREQESLAHCNKLLSNGAQQLLSITTGRGNDVFSCNWWMENEQNRTCGKLMAQSKIRTA